MLEAFAQNRAAIVGHLWVDSVVVYQGFEGVGRVSATSFASRMAQVVDDGVVGRLLALLARIVERRLLRAVAEKTVEEGRHIFFGLDVVPVSYE